MLSKLTGGSKACGAQALSGSQVVECAGRNIGHRIQTICLCNSLYPPLEGNAELLQTPCSFEAK